MTITLWQHKAVCCMLSLGAAKAAKAKCQSHIVIYLILFLLVSLHKSDKSVERIHNSAC